MFKEKCVNFFVVDANPLLYSAPGSLYLILRTEFPLIPTFPIYLLIIY